jgi:hypothetical protein
VRGPHTLLADVIDVNHTLVSFQLLRLDTAPHFGELLDLVRDAGLTRFFQIVHSDKTTLTGLDTRFWPKSDCAAVSRKRSLGGTIDPEATLSAAEKQTFNAGLQPPRSEATREPQARLAAVGCKAGLGVISSPQLALGALSTMLGASRDSGGWASRTDPE